MAAPPSDEVGLPFVAPIWLPPVLLKRTGARPSLGAMATSIDKKTMEKMDVMVLSYMRENGGSIPMNTTVSDEYGRKRQDELQKLGIKGPFAKTSESLKLLEAIEAK